jgi:hypothetical protein
MTSIPPREGGVRRPTSLADQLNAVVTEQIVIRPEITPETTALAQNEAIDIASGKLKRDENIRWHLHLGGIIAFWVGLVVGLLLVLVWAWHLAAPEGWQFLTIQQRFELQTIVLAVIGSSFVTTMAARWARTMDDDDR